MRLWPEQGLSWVACPTPGPQAGTLVLLLTPDGERVARLVVAPEQLLSKVVPLAGYAVVRELTEDEAILSEPAARLKVVADEGVDSRTTVRVRPDGSGVALLDVNNSRLTSAVAQLQELVGVPISGRAVDGEALQPKLPDLLSELEYLGVRYVVEKLSVFHGTITLRREGDELIALPLASVLADRPI